MEAVKLFGSKKKPQESTNNAQWIITGLEQNIVSNLSKYFHLSNLIANPHTFPFITKWTFVHA